MKISEAGLDLIRSFEGYHEKLPDGRCRAYLDRLAKPNVWTIGYGCTENIKKGMIWTREEAEAALRREMERFEKAVDRLVTVELNQNQFDALVSFAYNCGEGALAKSTLLKKLNKGDYKGAASEFKRWTYAGGKQYKGLVDRRAREATLFLTPVEQPDEPAMPQVVEEGPAKPSPATVATIGTAAGAAASQVVPAPDPTITESVTQLSAWQSLVTTARSLALFGVEHWPWVAAFVVTVGGLTWWSRREQS